MRATIKNTEGFEQWWFSDLLGTIVNVREYKYKVTRGAKTTQCSCYDCVREWAGKELFDAYEVIETGAIIPAICLEFERAKATLI